MKLTKAQREWLAKIATEIWTVSDIASGGCSHFPVGADGEFVWADESAEKVGT